VGEEVASAVNELAVRQGELRHAVTRKSGNQRGQTEERPV
jgi:hypothetical protein